MLSTTINLTHCPIVTKMIITGSSLQHITLNPRRKQIIYKAGSKQKHRIFFGVSKFLADTIQANATKPLELGNLQQLLQSWMDDVCAISFKIETSRQAAIETKAINAGKQAILEGLGLDQSHYVSHEEDTSPTPSAEPVSASQPEPVTAPATPTTWTIHLPISDQKAVSLTLPIELTQAQAELIANSSLDYIRALLLAKYKE